MRQRLNLGEDSVEQHKKDTLKGGDFYGIPELVDIFVNGATPGIDWLIEEGNVVFRESINRGGGHTAYRARKVTEGIGRGISDPMKKIAESRGAKIRLGTEVTWLWRKDANSPVLGVEVARGKRKSNIRAKRAVVLASGGFGADKKMRMSFNPSIVPEYNTTNQPGATAR
jgi:fumarate reductase flavoprotein subunit